MLTWKLLCYCKLPIVYLKRTVIDCGHLAARNRIISRKFSALLMRCVGLTCSSNGLPYSRFRARLPSVSSVFSSVAFHPDHALPSAAVLPGHVLPVCPGQDAERHSERHRSVQQEALGQCSRRTVRQGHL